MNIDTNRNFEYLDIVFEREISVDSLPDPGRGVLTYLSPDNPSAVRWDLESADERYGPAEKIAAIVAYLERHPPISIIYGER